MKVQDDFTALLKNFAQINPSIVFQQGNKIRTLSPARSVFAVGNISEEIETNCAIGDISKFLNVLSLFDQPMIEFDKKTMLIYEANRKSKSSIVTYADPIYIVHPQGKDPALKDVRLEFKVSKQTIVSIQKALAIFDQPDIAFVGHDGKVTIKTVNSDSPIVDGFSLDLYDEGDPKLSFNLVFAKENLPLIAADYTVQLSNKFIELANEQVRYVATSKSEHSHFYD